MTEKPSQQDQIIRVGIVGIGAMGKGLVYQSLITAGIHCTAVADIKVERCTHFLQSLHIHYQIVHTLDEMHLAIRKGLVAVCEDGQLIAQCGMIDAFLDASTSISEASEYAIMAIKNGKHLVLMNSELDLILGPYLANLAKENGVIYTSCDGDQYGVLKRLADDLQVWGFGLVMAGNIKGFLDRSANPTSIVPEADKRNLDYKMCTSYTDGTKLCIEMALIANALGLRTAVPGMFGPHARHVQDVFQLFDFPSLWDGKQGVVDYILGAEPGGGVFVIGYCDNKYQMDMLEYYKMGKGPFYLFYRPYHLCHIEAFSSLFNAVKDNKVFLQPDFGFQTNVFAYAKRDLRVGETLDGIGGYTCYGLIENCAEPSLDHGLPICLSDNVVLKKNIAKHQKIFLSDVQIEPGRKDFLLFQKAAALIPRK